MEWARPQYSKRKVNLAGKTYVDPESSREDREQALVIINNWRSSHSFPLNTFQAQLRRKAREIDPDATVSQRLKRLPSIRHKLERMPNVPLDIMQDIGGCRAVMKNVGDVYLLRDAYKESRIRHELVGTSNYLDTPKLDGYRSLHLIYRYNSDKNTHYNGMRIEMQLRTQLQHAWATAVEVVDILTRQQIKLGKGEAAWREFFVLMSCAIAEREGCPLVPNAPGDVKQRAQRLKELAVALDVSARLGEFGRAIHVVEKEYGFRPAEKYWLIELDLESRSLMLRTYRTSIEADDAYGAIERAIADDPRKDAVLVSAESIAQLKSAYPNYFLDTDAFMSLVRQAIR